MSSGSLALRDYYSKRFQDPPHGILRGSAAQIPIYYKYGTNQQVIANCEIHIDLVSSDWTITIEDPKGILCYNTFSTRYQDFSFNQKSGTLTITGVDNRTQKKYSISIS